MGAVPLEALVDKVVIGQSVENSWKTTVGKSENLLRGDRGNGG
jgi:hypothetical protein